LDILNSKKFEKDKRYISLKKVKVLPDILPTNKNRTNTANVRQTPDGEFGRVAWPSPSPPHETDWARTAWPSRSFTNSDDKDSVSLSSSSPDYRKHKYVYIVILFKMAN